jgi:hypothetical protein
VLYFGLESFNQATLDDMNKCQNALDQTRRVIGDCRRHGILATAGLVLSPTMDDCGYIAEIPAHLRACGLHVPSFICFEVPFPGTPHFQALAARAEPALLPDARLRDFTSYTLVTRPQRETPKDFVNAYRRTLATVYGPWNRLTKLADDLPRFLSGLPGDGARRFHGDPPHHDVAPAARAYLSVRKRYAAAGNRSPHRRGFRLGRATAGNPRAEAGVTAVADSW